MGDADSNTGETIPVLPGDTPVAMPDLPLKRVINTEQQFKQPATAKQIASRLGATPGAIGHHLHVLEEAGLAQIVARRLVRGIVANYYTRTARIFAYDLPADVVGGAAVPLDIVTAARDELAEALASGADDTYSEQSFPHVRLSPERAQLYYERLKALVEDILQEQPDPDGAVYGFLVAMFKSPPYMQGAGASTPSVDA
jgi:predicted ArsR family transcriptional regulator